MNNKRSLGRRDWFRSAFAISSGLTLTGALADRLMAAPVSDAEVAVFGNMTAANAVKLNSNENPFGPSEKARRALQAAIMDGNRYPFQETTRLKEILAAKEGVTPDHIHLGAGSGELLSQTGKAFGADGGSVVSAFPTFPMLMNHAEVFNCRWEKVNLNDRLEHDYEAMAAAVKADTRLIFVCNPNNPTGTLVDPAKVHAFVEAMSDKTTVFADEAYLEFLEPSQQRSHVDLVKKGKNVIVSKTFSKIHGLAGLRLGYLVARPDILKKIARYAGDIPLSNTAVAAAEASLGDEAFMGMTREKNAAARKILTDHLDAKGIFYGKTHTNFVFFKAPTDGKTILSRLQEQGYLIRIWEYRQQEWCRVSIGTSEQMTGFVSTFSRLFS